MLALALGKTVGELQDSMTDFEFAAWMEFYRKWPFDDFHRFHRPAALVATSLGNGNASALAARLDACIQWLQPKERGQEDDESEEGGFSAADRATLAALLGAKG